MGSNKVYQCPLTGFLYFYNKLIVLIKDYMQVSMPFNGLSLFLPLIGSL